MKIICTAEEYADLMANCQFGGCDGCALETACHRGRVDLAELCEIMGDSND